MLQDLIPTIETAGYAQAIIKLDGGAAAENANPADLADKFLDPEPLRGETPAAAATAPPLPRVRVYPNLGLALGYVDRAGAEALAATPGVADIFKAQVPSLIRPVAAKAARQTVNPSWGVRAIGAPDLWNLGYTGQGVIVGHIDTGVDGSHPALTGAIHSFAEFDHNGDAIPGAQPRDSGRHGTHTAGTILGRSGGMGAFGVAPDALLASALVIEGGNVVARILGGMEWVVGQGARVLSASLGLRGMTPAFQALTDALRARNILPVFAVGNEGVGTSRSPGNYANVLSVGAMDQSGNVAGFSGSQRFLRTQDPHVPDLVAPGVGVLSCVPGGQFMRMDGTSMATPHVAGLAALLFSAVPAATADDVEDAIQFSCKRNPTMDVQRANRGLPDALVALHRLQGGGQSAIAAE